MTPVAGPAKVAVLLVVAMAMEVLALMDSLSPSIGPALVAGRSELMGDL
jgi:hypothetical protein